MRGNTFHQKKLELVAAAFFVCFFLHLFDRRDISHGNATKLNISEVSLYGFVRAVSTTDATEPNVMKRALQYLN